MREIAVAAGVSHATVSLALRNHPSLPLKTRERIKKLAKRMGYERDPVLLALNAYRQKQSAPKYRATLAWLNTWPKRDGLNRAFEFLEYKQGLEARAQEFGYIIEEFWLHEEGMTPAKQARIMSRRGIQGLFLPPAPAPDFSLNFPWERFAVVAFAFSHRAIFHLVANAQHRATRLAFSKLHGLGYRKIAFLSVTEITERADYNFYAGYIAATTQLGADPWVFALSQRDELSSGKSKFRDWFHNVKPDVILVPSTWYAEWITREIKLAIPQQVSVAVLSVSQDERRLAGVNQCNLEVGAAAMDEMISLINRNDRGIPTTPLRILVEGKWQNGTSAPKVKPVGE